MKTVESAIDFDKECRAISRELINKHSNDEIEKRINYCKENFFKITCDICKYSNECGKINDEIPKIIVSGKPCGAYFLQDIKNHLNK